MEINNNDEDDIVYYSLFDNYSIWTLETIVDEPPSSGPPFNTSSFIDKNGDNLVLSTVDVPVHKKRNLIRNLEGMIEELQQKVMRLQDEVDDQDVASTLLGVRGPRVSQACRCSAPAQLQVLQKKFQSLELERDNLLNQISNLRNNNSENEVTRRIESENRLLQEKLKLSMEKLSQVTKDLLKKPGLPTATPKTDAVNDVLQSRLLGKIEDFKSDLLNVANDQVSVKAEFLQLQDFMIKYLNQLETATARLLKKQLEVSSITPQPKNTPETRSQQKPALQNGQRTPPSLHQTPPRSSKSPTAVGSRTSSSAKLKQRSNSLQNDKPNLSLFGRSISISDVDGESGRSDVTAPGSDVGVYCLDIVQSVIRCSESPNAASLDVITHQRSSSRGGVRVLCRVRPLLASDGPGALKLHEQVPCVVVQHKNRTKVFDMDCLLGEQSTQEDVHFSLKENALAILRGHRSSIISYGITSSGKTYTMQGTPIESGLIKRLLEDLLEHKDNNHYITVSATENRNDSFRDIFDVDPKSRLEIKTMADGSLQLFDLSELALNSEADVKKVIKKLQTCRQSASSQLSHLVVQFKVVAKIDEQLIEIGKLSLLELACSERFDKATMGDAGRWKEAQWVAKSLTALDEVLQAVAQKKPHVPYRTSKLTHLLQDCLGTEESSIDVIIHLHPAEKLAGETTASLMLAQRLRNNDVVLSNIAHSSRMSGKCSPLALEEVNKPRRPSIGSRSMINERRGSLSAEKASNLKKEPTVYKNGSKF